MNKNIILGITYGLILTFVFTNPAFAAANCYGSLSAEPKTLGEIIPCVLNQSWQFMKKIFVAMALILTMYLIFVTVKNRENSKALEELPSKWMYLIIFALLAFGAGGTILNIIFKFLGFGALTQWISWMNTIFSKWMTMASGF